MGLQVGSPVTLALENTGILFPTIQVDKGDLNIIRVKGYYWGT